MHLPTLFLLLLIALAVLLSIRFLRRNGTHSCGDCSRCHESCRLKEQMEKKA